MSKNLYKGTCDLGEAVELFLSDSTETLKRFVKTGKTNFSQNKLGEQIQKEVIKGIEEKRNWTERQIEFASDSLARKSQLDDMIGGALYKRIAEPEFIHLTFEMIDKYKPDMERVKEQVRVRYKGTNDGRVLSNLAIVLDLFGWTISDIKNQPIDKLHALQFWKGHFESIEPKYRKGVALWYKRELKRTDKEDCTTLLGEKAGYELAKKVLYEKPEDVKNYISGLAEDRDYRKTVKDSLVNCLFHPILKDIQRGDGRIDTATIHWMGVLGWMGYWNADGNALRNSLISFNKIREKYSTELKEFVPYTPLTPTSSK
ncbi:hypothetical protein J4209_07235 [Candidatus Woesearchaeota archaeon]|nr:hypothetical protein [Candidatus Woesearchaeota archaeon]